MLDAVLFDLDGTLADTALDLGAALNQLRLDAGLDALPHDILRPHTSSGVRGLLGAGFGLAPGHPEYADAARRFLDHYARRLCVATTLFDGMADLLDRLDAAQVPWGIVTNKSSRFTRPLVSALDLHRRAACVVSGDSARRPKPSPQPLLMAANLMGLPAQRCAYVGDDQRDMVAARCAGMLAVAAAYGYLGVDLPIEQWGADRIVDAPPQIAECLELGG